MTYCLGLFLPYNSGVEQSWQRADALQSLKYLLPGLLQKKFANAWSIQSTEGSTAMFLPTPSVVPVGDRVKALTRKARPMAWLQPTLAGLQWFWQVETWTCSQLRLGPLSLLPGHLSLPVLETENLCAPLSLGRPWRTKHRSGTWLWGLESPSSMPFTQEVATNSCCYYFSPLCALQLPWATRTQREESSPPPQSTCFSILPPLPGNAVISSVL